MACKHSLLWSATLLLAAAPCLAQTAPASGSVTGRVLCSDTQLPARFASITLFSVPSSASTPALPPDVLKDAVKDKSLNLGSLMRSALGSVNFVQATTGLNGTYTADGVAPGDYYVFAAQPGYITPTEIVHQLIDSGADPKKPLPGIPIAHVAANQQVTVDVTLQRGAALSGRVLWDDGSPVARVQVTGVPVPSSPTSTSAAPPEPETGKTWVKRAPQFAMLTVADGGAATPSGAMMAITDDLGHYRLAGIAPGKYDVKAMLQISGGISMSRGSMNLSGILATSTLDIFAPSAFHQSGAAAVTLAAGQDQTDEDITFNLSGTHSVSGTITSAADQHAINSGIVTLVDTSDKEFTRKTAVAPDGTYTVKFVPAGNYKLTVTMAADTETPQGKSTGLFAMNHTLRSYEDGKATVLVADSDVTGENLVLTPSKTNTPDIDINSIFSTPPPSTPKP